MISFITVSIYVSSHKKELVEKARVAISEVVGGKVFLEDITVAPFKNFPYLSIALQNVSVTDSQYAVHHHQLFSARKIFVRINPFALLLAKISLNKLQIDSGSLYLFTDTSGYTNAYLLQGKKKNSNETKNKSTRNVLDLIELNDFSATVEDRRKDKLFDILINHLQAKTKNEDSLLSFHVQESILVKDLAFKLAKGSYLHNQLLEGDYTLSYQPSTQSLLFEKLLMNINKQPFLFTGSLVFGTVQEFRFNIIAKHLLVDDAKKMLTPPIAKAVSLVSVAKPLDVAAAITGSLAGGDPLVHVNWVAANNSITTPLLNFTNCSFSGSYNNEVVAGKERDDPNSEIQLHDFTGSWQGMVMQSKSILITDLKNPLIRCDMHSAFALSSLNSVLQTDAIALTGGQGLLDLRYAGPIEHISPQNASITGSLFLDSGTIHTTAGNADLTRCRGNIRFANKDIIVDSLFGRLSGNPFRMWGNAKNTLALLGDSKDPVSLSWNLYAPLLNIDHISSIFLRKIPNKRPLSATKNTSIAKTAQQIDNLLSSGHVAVSVRADKLIYHHFEGSHLQADLVVDANSWSLNKAALNYGKGSLDLSAKVIETSGGRFTMNSELHLASVDAKKTFYAFDNFGISAISYKNIDGTLSANAKVSIGLDKTGSFDMGSLNGSADFSILNGALVQFKPVMKVQEFAFKTRDFSNIRFAEIKDKLRFGKGQIEMDRMELNSSVLSLFVEGVYGIKGNTDISIQVPLKNLKKRDKDYQPENMGTDSRGGISVFLRAKSSEDGSIKIKYDPFRRFRKS